ncbi:glutathione S-transferase [Massilia sp. JS1662]|nr:glutathione transferase [Massilia sp. JS1662]KGF78985.1 glutathione S-transferase [Massilia sp. JS1662]
MLLYVDAQYASPYAMSVFVGLKEKGIPFDMQTLDLGAGANRSADYATTSLTQRVPTLADGDFRLSESSAMTEYLDDVYAGTALYPADPKAKARARQIQAWLRSDLLPIRQERTTEVLFYGPSNTPLSTAAEQAAQKLFKAADTLLAQDREHLFETWCIADVDLAVMLNRLVLNGDDVPARLALYAKRQWERASVQAWVDLPRPPL